MLRCSPDKGKQWRENAPLSEVSHDLRSIATRNFYKDSLKVINNPSRILPIATEIFHFINGQFNQFLVACPYHLGHMLPFLQNSTYEIHKHILITIT